jgi:hypothetical protein
MANCKTVLIYSTSYIRNLEEQVKHCGQICRSETQLEQLISFSEQLTSKYTVTFIFPQRSQKTPRYKRFQCWMGKRQTSHALIKCNHLKPEILHECSLCIFKDSRLTQAVLQLDLYSDGRRSNHDKEIDYPTVL